MQHSGRIAFLLLCLAIVACSEISHSTVATDFFSRRPTSVAVLPVAVLDEASRPMSVPLDIATLLSPEYASLTKLSLGVRDEALSSLRLHVETKFKKLNLKVVPYQDLARILPRYLGKGGLEARQLADALGVDSLAFVSLQDWRFVTEAELAHRGTLKVLMEVSLYHAARGDLIWVSHNEPQIVHYASRDSNVALAQLTHNLVNSIFSTYPAVKVN